MHHFRCATIPAKAAQHTALELTDFSVPVPGPLYHGWSIYKFLFAMVDTIIGGGLRSRFHGLTVEPGATGPRLLLRFLLLQLILLVWHDGTVCFVGHVLSIASVLNLSIDAIRFYIEEAMRVESIFSVRHAAINGSDGVKESESVSIQSELSGG